jgi:transcriptional regulator with XRE-family HTH domain
MHSFIPSAIRRYRNQRRLTLENVSGIAGMSVQHLSAQVRHLFVKIPDFPPRSANRFNHLRHFLSPE